jgi:hypothetical protein
VAKFAGSSYESSRNKERLAATESANPCGVRRRKTDMAGST